MKPCCKNCRHGFPMYRGNESFFACGNSYVENSVDYSVVKKVKLTAGLLSMELPEVEVGDPIRFICKRYSEGV